MVVLPEIPDEAPESEAIADDVGEQGDNGPGQDRRAFPAWLFPVAISRPPRRVLVALGCALAALVAAAAATWFHFSPEREKRIDFSAVPFRILSSLPIAENVQDNDGAALTLICVDGKKMRMVLHAKLTQGKAVHSAGEEDRGVLYVGDPNNRIETSMSIVQRGTSDVLVSKPLSGTALGALGAFFGDHAPARVSIVTMATATELVGTADKARIATFAAACR